MTLPHPIDTPRAEEWEQLASRLGPLGALSGVQRRRIAAALGAAATLERERLAAERDRASLRELLATYRGALTSANAELRRFAAAVEKAFAAADETNRSTVTINEAATRRQVEARALLERLADEHLQVRATQDELRRIQAETAMRQGQILAAEERLDRERSALVERELLLVQGEGALAATRAELARREAAANAVAEKQRAEDARLRDLQERVATSHREAILLEQRLAALLEHVTAAHRAVADPRGRRGLAPASATPGNGGPPGPHRR